MHKIGSISWNSWVPVRVDVLVRLNSGTVLFVTVLNGTVQK